MNPSRGPVLNIEEAEEQRSADGEHSRPLILDMAKNANE